MVRSRAQAFSPPCCSHPLTITWVWHMRCIPLLPSRSVRGPDLGSAPSWYPFFLSPCLHLNPDLHLNPVLAPRGSLPWKYIFILIHSSPTARLLSKSSWVYTHLFKSLWYSFNSSPIKSSLHFTTHYVAQLWRLQLFLICLSPNQMAPFFPVRGISFHLYPDPTSPHPASKPYISQTSTCSSYILPSHFLLSLILKAHIIYYILTGHSAKWTWCILQSTDVA